MTAFLHDMVDQRHLTGYNLRHKSLKKKTANSAFIVALSLKKASWILTQERSKEIIDILQCFNWNSACAESAPKETNLHRD